MPEPRTELDVHLLGMIFKEMHSDAPYWSQPQSHVHRIFMMYGTYEFVRQLTPDLSTYLVRLSVKELYTTTKNYLMEHQPELYIELML